jgi:hypothetical protein
MALRPDLSVPVDDNTADDYAALNAADQKRADYAALAARAASFAAASEDQVAPGGAELDTTPEPIPTSANQSFDRGPAKPADAAPEKEWWDTLDVVKQSMRGGATGVLEIAKFPAEVGAAVGVPGANWAESALNDQINLQTSHWGEATSTAGAIAKPVAQFGAGALVLGGAGRALGIAKKIAGASKVTQAAIAGTATGTLAFDPHDERLSNILSDRKIGGAVTDWLASNEDDSALEGRFKSLIENAGMGVGLHLGGNVVKAVAKSERLRYFLNKDFVLTPPSQEIMQVVEDIGAARGAIKDIKGKVGVSPVKVAADGVESPELTKLKASKAEMKAIRDDRIAKFEALKGTYEYKKLHHSVRERLEAAAEGRTAKLPRDAKVAMEDELGRRAVGRVAADLKKGLSEVATKAARMTPGEMDAATTKVLTDNFNIGIMEMTGPEETAVWGEALRGSMAVAEKRFSDPAVAGTFEAKHFKSVEALVGKTDPATFLRNFSKLAGYVKNVGAAMHAAEDISKNFARQFVALSKEAAVYPGEIPAELQGKLVQAMENIQGFQAALKGVQRETARGVYSRRFRSGVSAADINLDTLDRAVSDKFLSKENLARVTREIAMLDGDEAAVLQALGRNKHPYMSAVREYYTNSLLSGPITSIINFSGNTMKMLWDPVDQGMEAMWGQIGKGASVRSAFGNAAGEMKAVYGSFIETGALFARTFAKTLEMTPSAFGELSQARRLLQPKTLAGNVKEAWSSSKSVLAGGGFSAEAQARNASITSEALLGDQASSMLKAAVDWTGKVVRLPTRTMTTVDEAFTGMNFFMHARRESYRLGSEQGLKGAKLREFMRDFVEKADDKTLDGVFKRSLESAKRNVWQDELGTWGKKFQGLLEEHPGTGLVIPFFKTPVNILKYTAAHHPVGVMLQGAFGKDHLAWKFLFGSGEGRRALLATKEGADFAGRFTTSSLMTAAAAATIDGSWITGRAPADLKAREAWEATGRTEYSIRVGDRWISYGRLDPFGMLIGAQADFFLYGPQGASGGRASDDDVQSHELGWLTLVGSMAQMFQSRNYLQGVVQSFGALAGVAQGDYGPLGKFVTQTAGGFVPNVISQLNGRIDFGILDASPVVRDSNEYGSDGRIDLLSTFANSLRTRAGSDMAPRKWTAFGPSVRKSGIGWDLVSPLAGSQVRGSAFAKELAANGVSPVFTDQQRKFMDFPIPFGHRDRMGELMATVKVGGKTLAEKGEELAADPRYQSLPSAERGDAFKSKKDILSKMLLGYQKAAFQALTKEHKDVGVQFSVFKRAQKTPDAAPAKAIKSITGIKQ